MEEQTKRVIECSWLETANAEVEQNEKDKNAQTGYKPALQLPEGESWLEIDLAKPERKIETVHGYRWVYDLKSHPENVLMASAYLRSVVIKALKDGYNPICLLKTGKGKGTKYKALPKTK